LIVLRVHRGAELGAMNTLALPSRAGCLVGAANEAQIEEALALARDEALPVFVLGGGSNLVLSRVLDALVLQPVNRGISRAQCSGQSVEFTVAAGEQWHALVIESLARGWFGLENLALIPGTVGAAPVQNIGAYGVELERFIVSVRAFDLEAGRWRDFDRDSCGFSYRDSCFRHGGGQRFIISAVTLRLSLTPEPEIRYSALAAQLEQQQSAQPTPQDVFQAVVAIRRRRLPAPELLPNAGSFFKNPLVSHGQYGELLARFPGLVGYGQGEAGVKLAAAWLIEQSGFKGHRSNVDAAGGGVGMHDQQALVLVNYGGASADEVLAYANQVSAAVRAQFGVTLAREPQWIRADGSRA
jgi:UDP-N-acetylmuramate dehydrogenase